MRQMSNQKLTLSQYIQTYKIRKKFYGRRSSKSKNKNTDDSKSKNMIFEQSKTKQQSILQTLDSFLKNTKQNLQDIITNQDLKGQQLFIFMSNMLEKMIFHLKKQISQTFKNMYWYYSFQNQYSELNVKDHPQYEAALNFFTKKYNQAKQQQAKKQYKEILEKMQKADQQYAQAAKLLIDDFVNLTQSTQKINPYEHKATYKEKQQGQMINSFFHKSAYTQKESQIVVKDQFYQQIDNNKQSKIIEKSQNQNKRRKNTFLNQNNNPPKLVKKPPSNNQPIVIQQNQKNKAQKDNQLIQTTTKRAQFSRRSKNKQ